VSVNNAPRENDRSNNSSRGGGSNTNTVTAITITMMPRSQVDPGGSNGRKSGGGAKAEEKETDREFEVVRMMGGWEDERRWSQDEKNAGVTMGTL
jgi:hypothetical protein